MYVPDADCKRVVNFVLFILISCECYFTISLSLCHNHELKLLALEELFYVLYYFFKENGFKHTHNTSPLQNRKNHLKLYTFRSFMLKRIIESTHQF